MTTDMTTALLLAQAATAPPASGARLVVAALVGIALLVVLITRYKMHPFLALTIGSLVVAGIAGLPVAAAITGYLKGFGDTAAGVGTLIALGAMFGKLLADSGGGDQIADTIIGRSSTRTLPWAMAAVGALIGLPMFFEIGLVLLMPVIFLVARRSGLSLIKVGIPALAGLSVMHGLVPPHPGPLVAIAALNANLGITLLFGVLIAIPTVAIAGPLFARYAARWVDVPAPHLFDDEPDRGPTAGGNPDPGGPSGSTGAATALERRTIGRPTFTMTLLTVLLPVVLMMGKALAAIFIADKANPVRSTLDFLGTPLIALLIAVLVAMFTLGRGSGMDTRAIAGSLEQSLPPIAGILLIVAAGGGFKQTLIDTKIADLIASFVTGGAATVLLAGWFIAVLIRLATGSATVATVTASGILAPLVTTLDPTHTSLLVLAIGAGSLFFSHVNDAGFWLVKEYFGLVGRPDHQDLVDHGDHHLGRRPGVRPAAGSRGLTRPGRVAARRPVSDARRASPVHECGRSNSPRLTPSTNASHSGAVNTSTGPSGSRELRSGTQSPQKRTSTQALYWLRLLLRHVASGCRRSGSRVTGSSTSGSRRRDRARGACTRGLHTARRTKA